MVSLEEAKKNIRQELKSHYGENLVEIVGSPLVKHLQNDLVIDATVDVDKKFRITVYLNTRDMVDDEPNGKNRLIRCSMCWTVKSGRLDVVRDTIKTCIS